MKRVAIVSTTLGLGTALVFGAAVLASVMFPNGSTVASQWNGAVFAKGIAVPAPMPEPLIIQPGGMDDGKGGAVWDRGVTTTP
jgi:hypothetical protein